MLKELKDFRHDAWQCFRDSICKQVFTWHNRDGINFWQSCPSLAYKSFAAYSGQGRFDLARGFIEGEISWSPKLLEILYLCQLDGHCEYNCGRVMELRPASTIQAFRAQAIKDGQTPPGGFKDFLAGLREYNNPYKKLDAERINWMKDLPAGKGRGKTAEAPSRTKTLLYVGCGVMRDSSAQNLPRTAFKILQEAGVDVGILGDAERCCGNPALRVGDADTFLAMAKENIKKFNELGVEKLVTLCPFCYSTFRRDYPDVGDRMNFQVIHIMDYVNQLLQEGNLKPKKAQNLNITYHDPCHLGRISGYGYAGCNDFQGLYDAPRAIIKAIPGITLSEMWRTRDNTWCCGAGGWMRYGFPEFADWTADERVKEAKATGAQGIATYCYHCEENLGMALERDGGKMKMYNVLDLLLETL